MTRTDTRVIYFVVVVAVAVVVVNSPMAIISHKFKKEDKSNAHLRPQSVPRSWCKLSTAIS